MARCKVYEIQGADPVSTAGAVRCHRDSVAKVDVDDKKSPVCKKHRSADWHLFRKDGWLYAVTTGGDG